MVAKPTATNRDARETPGGEKGGVRNEIKDQGPTEKSTRISSRGRVIRNAKKM